MLSFIIESFRLFNLFVIILDIDRIFYEAYHHRSSKREGFITTLINTKQPVNLDPLESSNYNNYNEITINYVDATYDYVVNAKNNNSKIQRHSRLRAKNTLKKTIQEFKVLPTNKVVHKQTAESAAATYRHHKHHHRIMTPPQKTTIKNNWIRVAERLLLTRRPTLPKPASAAVYYKDNNNNSSGLNYHHYLSFNTTNSKLKTNKIYKNPGFDEQDDDGSKKGLKKLQTYRQLSKKENKIINRDRGNVDLKFYGHQHPRQQYYGKPNACTVPPLYENSFYSLLHAPTTRILVGNSSKDQKSNFSTIINSGTIYQQMLPATPFRSYHNLNDDNNNQKTSTTLVPNQQRNIYHPIEIDNRYYIPKMVPQKAFSPANPNHNQPTIANNVVLEHPPSAAAMAYVFPYNAQIRYHCNYGYRPISSATSPISSTSLPLKSTDFVNMISKCTISPDKKFEWTKPSFLCSAIDCRHPGLLIDGYVNVTSYTYMSRALYVCLPGFDLIGNPSRDCLLNNEWSGEIPKCQKKKCAKIDLIQNGRVLGTDYNFGSLVQFECNRGYNLVGDRTAICSNQGKWMPRVPTCKMIDCGPPGEVYNGYSEYNSTTWGSMVVFWCAESSSFVGNSQSAVCLHNGTWSHPIPRCLKHCQLNDLFSSSPSSQGKIEIMGEKEFKFGDFISQAENVTYRCIRKSSSTSTDTYFSVCQNGTFKPPIACKPEQCKDLPPRIKNGRYILIKASHGSMVKYVCDAGYKVIANDKIICTHGEWLGELPKCSNIMCMFPGVLEHGDVLLVGSYGEYNYRDYIANVNHGRQIVYKCEKDFHVSQGPHGATCINGDWIPPEKPACTSNLCPQILSDYRQLVKVYKENGEKYVTTIYRRRGIVHHSYLNKEATTTLFSYKKDNPVNKPRDLTSLLKANEIKGINEGEGDTTEFRTEGAIVEVICIDENYELSRNSSPRVQCVKGKWVPAWPICVPKACTLPITNNGKYYFHDVNSLIMAPGSQVAHEETVRLVCLNGYHLSGRQIFNFTCVFSQWNPQLGGLFCVQDTDERKTITNQYSKVAISTNYFLTTSSSRNPMNQIAAINPTITFTLSSHEWGINAKNQLVTYPYVRIILKCHYPDTNFGSPNWKTPHSSNIFYQTKWDSSDSDENGNDTYVSKSKVSPNLTMTRRATNAILSLIIDPASIGTADKAAVAFNASGIYICVTPTGDTYVDILVTNDISCPLPPSITDDRYLKMIHTTTHSSIIVPTAESSVLNPIVITDQSPDKIPNSELRRDNSRRNDATTTYTIGTKIKFACIEGFRVYPGDELSCTAYGNWTYPVPQCIEITCPDLSPYVNGKSLNRLLMKRSSSYVYNSLITFSCPKGSLLHGEEHIVCLYDGTWSSPVPTCIDILCPEPKNLKNGYFMVIEKQESNVSDEEIIYSEKNNSSNNDRGNESLAFKFETVLEYKCDENFKMLTPPNTVLDHNNNNHHRIKCLENGQWSNDLNLTYTLMPKCVPI